jgi:uncharacterized ubiquitin-like protein YukD
MGICWQSTGDSSSKVKTSRLNNQIITANIQQPTQINQNQKKEENRNNINTIIESKTNININLDSSFEESIRNFPDMPEWGEGIMKGYGIKQMPAYKCDLKIDELNKKREEFWSTKTKYKTKWKIIHQACIYDHITAEEFLYKNKIKTLEGCINMCTDEQGYIFRVPNYCINDPYFQLELLSKEKTKGDILEIKLYDVLNQKQINLSVPDSATGKELIQKFVNEENIDLTKNKIRLIFGGGIIKENETLFQHKVKNGFIIQVCVTQF